MKTMNAAPAAAPVRAPLELILDRPAGPALSRRRGWVRALAMTSALVTVSPSMLLASATPARAQTAWTGAHDKDWFAGSNWSTNAAPTSADNVIVDIVTPNPTVVDGAAANTAFLYVGNSGDGMLTVQDGGTVNSTFGVLGALAGSAGTVGVTGPGSTWTDSGNLDIGSGGTGVLDVANGATVSDLNGSVGLSAGSTGTATVSGAGSTWTNAGGLFVGFDGAGTINILNGGLVRNTDATLGYDAASIGTATVAGAGSTWNNAGPLYVGQYGTGTLAVGNGGAVNDTDGYLGLRAGSLGTATVTGPASTWVNSGDLFVGEAGTGTLTIAGGGTASNANGVVGDGAGSQGTATVTDAGSAWNSTNALYVGHDGTGMLTIANGGTVNDPLAYVGFASGSQGTVAVTDAGSTWANSNDLAIGFLGTGTLTIANGGAVSDTTGTIGTNMGSQGTVTVTGPDSAWINAGDLLVGDRSTGALAIADGAAVSNVDGLLGIDAGGQGTVVVADAGSAWTNAGNLVIGNRGTGELTIADGGIVSDTAGTLGSDAGAVGTVTVTDAGSAWTSSHDLYIGYDGSGTLAVGDGGAIDDSAGYLGVNPDSQGTATVAGPDSAWTNANDLYIGDTGTGTLTIETGGAVSDSIGFLAYNPGSRGAATVTGTGSSWTNANVLYAGVAGAGTLAVADGGAVSDLVGYLGLNAGAQGMATVAGDGSAWNNTGGLFVGFDGVGTLTVEDGGAVNTAFCYFGLDAGSQGTVTVNGAGSVLTNTRDLYVGDAGAGAITIENGGAVSNAAGLIGFSAGSQGTATVTGDGSAWTSSGNLFIGDAGTGTLTVANGGSVSADAILVADIAGSTGTLTIGAAAGDPAAAPGTLDTPTVFLGDGAGTINFNHTGTGYRFASAIGGAGTVEQLAGTTILTGTSSYVGATDIRGGVLRVEGALGDTTVSVEDGATLGGSGSIAGAVIVADGGTIGPGSSPGTLTVGSLALNGGSVLDYELGRAGVIGSGANDLIEVSGDLTLDGTLDVTDVGGFGAGVYRLMDYGGTMTDNGLSIGALPMGVDPADLFVQTSIAGQINLISSSGVTLGFWDGGDAALHDNGAIDGGDGIWNAANRDWTEADGAINGPWGRDFAVFGGQAGTVTVDGSAGAIGFAGMQFMTDGYVIAGDALTTNAAETIMRVDPGVTAAIAAGIAGTGGVIKTDAGTLVLSGANSYAGGTTIDAGTLSVSSDGNLGAASGGVTFDGGTLRNTAAFTTARGMVLDAGGGTFRTDADLVAGGALSGAGALTKTGVGTLTLTGSNSYTGGTTIAAGTLRLGNGSTSGSIAGDITDNATLAFDRSDDVTFGGHISGSGALEQRGSGTTIFTNANTYAGGTTIAAGTLQLGNGGTSGSIAGDVVDTATLAFDRSDGVTFVGRISGTGHIEQIGSGTTTLTADSSAFGGTTTVSDGTLFIDGALGGVVDVGAGATLAGTGTAGAVHVAGTIAPGHSIGTLHVAGTYMQAPGSTYVVELDAAGNSDLIDVAGAATLDGGTIDVTPSPDFALGTRYTILTAAGGVTGAFDDVSAAPISAFLGPELSYDANDAFLTITLTASFESAALTPNQKAVAAGADSLGPGSDIWTTLAFLPSADDAPPAFDALSGEVDASLQAGLVEDSRFLREAVGTRLRAASVSAGARAPHGGDASDAARATTGGLAVWGNGFGSWGTWSGNGNAAGLSRDIGGFFTGVDAPIGRWRFGLLAGYSRSTFDVADRASSGSADTYHVGLYGGARIGRVDLSFGAAHSWHSVETARSVAIANLEDRPRADYDAATTQVFGEAGYRIDAANASLEPFASLAYVRLHTDSFAEKGGAAALTASSSGKDVTFTTIGLRADVPFSLGDAGLRFHETLGWRHAIGDTTPTARLRVDGSDAFTIAGVPIARDTAAVEAALTWALSPNATFGVSYGGQFGASVADQSIKADFSVTF